MMRRQPPGQPRCTRTGNSCIFLGVRRVLCVPRGVLCVLCVLCGSLSVLCGSLSRGFASSQTLPVPDEAQALFTQGLASLHLFEYEDANEAFRRAQAAAPGFAMAYW